MAVTKLDIVGKIIDRLGFSQKQSFDSVEQLLEIMKSSLENEDHILISRFGKFSVKEKKERVGRNPATGDTMMLKQRKVVTFQHSATLKDLMNR
jgi:integration host factor subunit alpha